MDYTLKMSSIIYKEDIIKEMSSEMGIPEKELEEIVNLNTKYIKKSILEKEYLLINLPNLCKLRLNYKLTIGSLVVSDSSRPRVESLKRKKILLDNYRLRKTRYKLMSFKNPLYERLWRKFKRVKYNKNSYVNMHSMIKELEEETNRIIQEIE